VADLRCKEVINIHSGLRLGFVCDVVLNVYTGQATAILVPGQRKCLGLFGREDDYHIPWECIKRIGDDIILIEVCGEYRRERRERRWF
jgi:YlmC/YmxH family sporulation protein